MSRQLLIGLSISLVNIAIHALVMTSVVRGAYRVLAFTKSSPPNVRIVAVMMAAVTVLMAAHLCELEVWAGTYAMVGAVPMRVDSFYFAFVNYTTLGYGDILPLEHWRLLGPITAMNGVLLFGWSTAVIYEVLRTAARAITPDIARLVKSP